VHVLLGTIHTYKCVGETWGRMLVTTSPVGIEEFFAGLSQPPHDIVSATNVSASSLLLFIRVKQRQGKPEGGTLAWSAQDTHVSLVPLDDHA
jgi:hypothetical protein